MRILVAGGTGVLGRRVVPRLVVLGHEVHATTRSAGRLDFLASLGAHGVVADALDEAGWRELTRRVQPDVVLHLMTDLAEGTPATSAQLRRVGTAHLVASAAEVGARVVAESISWVNPPSSQAADESTPLDLTASEPRATSVTAVDELERLVLGHGGTVLRCGLLYGAGTWYAPDGKFGQSARAGELVASEAVACFVHSDDAADAFVAAIDWPAGVYAIVDDEPAPGTAWVAALAASVGGPEPQHQQSGDIGRPVSNAKARAAGWSPRFTSWRDGFAAEGSVAS